MIITLAACEVEFKKLYVENRYNGPEFIILIQVQSKIQLLTGRIA